MVFQRIQQYYSLMKKLNLIILALFCSLPIMGCATWKIPEVSKKPPLPPGEIQKILSRFTIEPEGYALKATANISVDYPNRKYTRKVAILVKRPSSLRVEAIPIFGLSDFFMTAKGKFFKVFLPGEGKFYIGNATEKNISRFFPIPIPFNETVSLLTGTPPIRMSENFKLTGYSEGGLHRIDAASGDMPLQSIWLDQANDNLIRVEVFGKDGNTTYTASFGNFIFLGDATYPKSLKIAVRGMKKIDVNIKYSELGISSGDDPSLFDLPVPPGITPTFLN